MGMIPKIDFDERAHRYTMRSTGAVIPGVTSIINPVIGQDFSMVDPDKLAEAAQLGKDVHKLIQLCIAGKIRDMDDIEDFRLLAYWDAWLDFIKTSGFKPFLSEQLVYSRKYGYCGQLDLFGELNGELVLPDIKRVNTVSRTAGVQTAAYLQALIESFPRYFVDGRPIKRYALHLRPGSKWQLVPFHSPTDLRVFLSALTIHNWKANTL
jgi:hypothetical protein